MELTDSEVAFLIASMRSSLSIELGYEKCPCVFFFLAREARKYPTIHRMRGNWYHNDGTMMLASAQYHLPNMY